MVVPVATSQQLARSFRSTLLAAMVLGGVAAVGGLVVSAWLSARATVAPGPSIVLLALAMFAATWPVGVWLRRRRRLAEPFPTLVASADTHEVAGPRGRRPRGRGPRHPHEHGDACGHPAVPHGDHVDYVHDGHRHAPHGEHYDEH